MASSTTDCTTNGSPKVMKPKTLPKETFEEVPLDRAILTYISYGILILWGYINDFLRRIGIKNDGFGDTCKNVS